jgi:hypothetical protein
VNMKIAAAHAFDYERFPGLARFSAIQSQ